MHSDRTAYDSFQLVDFVFRDHNEQDIGGLVRISSSSVPVGDAASGLFDDRPGDPKLFCKDHDAHVDVLDMYPVTCDGINHTVDQRIDNDFHIEHQKTDTIQRS